VRLNLLQVADDIVFMDITVKDLKIMAGKFYRASLQIGLEMNLYKTKIKTEDIQVTDEDK